MSYYQGDYYAGDPFLGGLLSGAGRLLSKIVPRKLIAPIVSKASPAAAGMARTAIERVSRPIIATISKHPVLSAAGGAAVLAAGAGAGAEKLAMHPAMGGMRGFHISRKSGRMVRNRRMRATNPRALRRALRRAYAFERVAMRTIHLLHPKKKARFGGFKQKRRRAA